MVFWIGMLIAAAFAWYAVKRGFYESWIILFNLVISIYLAISLNPVFANISVVGNSPYTNTLTIIVTTVGSFILLHAIAYICFMSQFNINLPKLFDVLGAGFLGFFAGFLLWYFISLIICITPITQKRFVKDVGFNKQSMQAGISYICFWADSVNAIVSIRDNLNTTEQMINDLLKEAEKNSIRKTTPKPEPNEPPEIRKPVEADISTVPDKVEPPITDDTNLAEPNDANTIAEQNSVHKSLTKLIKPTDRTKRQPIDKRVRSGRRERLGRKRGTD